MLEEEPQLVELDAAQDSVLGDYDHLANDLLNLKNRHRYMRHQLAILAKNALIGATENSKKNDGKMSSRLLRKYQAISANRLGPKKNRNDKILNVIMGDIVCAVSECVIAPERKGKFRDPKGTSSS